MASSNSPFSILLFFIILSLTKPSNSAAQSSSDSISIHDVLKSHALPIGLFPNSVSGFSLDVVSGRFQLHINNSPCDSKFETHFRYDSNVSGTISYGKISELSGISAQELFLWFPVKGIQVDIPSSGLIYFDVGVVSKQFSLSFFETPHDCSASLPEDAGHDRDDDKFSPPVDLSFSKGRGRSIKNPSEKSLKVPHKGHAGRAVS
ncbi:hypothetical protein ACH5RR_016135 [Cinchona calisaya]|uniref:Uncharacterized protein n=1 Tax=Cinchona calisaya TaxID=153742 RepID=A0ABD2ZX36_9GENT